MIVRLDDNSGFCKGHPRRVRRSDGGKRHDGDSEYLRRVIRNEVLLILFTLCVGYCYGL